jgi:hypothetical protein
VSQIPPSPESGLGVEQWLCGGHVVRRSLASHPAIYQARERRARAPAHDWPSWCSALPGSIAELRQGSPSTPRGIPANSSAGPRFGPRTSRSLSMPEKSGAATSARWHRVDYDRVFLVRAALNVCNV